MGEVLEEDRGSVYKFVDEEHYNEVVDLYMEILDGNFIYNSAILIISWKPNFF